MALPKTKKAPAKKAVVPRPRPALLAAAPTSMTGLLGDQRTRPLISLVFHGATAPHSPRTTNLRLVTVHEMLFGTDNVPMLGPGRPLLPADEDELVALLRGRAASVPRIYPAHILYAGPAGMVWWLKPEVRTMYLAAEGRKLTKIHSMWPNLVAAVVNRTLHIVCVKGDGRPEGATALFHAPLGNIDAEGRVCTGNAKLPLGTTISDIEGWNAVIFGTAFTHDNHGRPLLAPRTTAKQKRAAAPLGDRHKAHAFWIARNGDHTLVDDGVLVPMGMKLDVWVAELFGAKAGAA